MKYVARFTICLLLLGAGFAVAQNQHSLETVPPIYVSIVMHCETGYPDFTVDTNAFWINRFALETFAHMLHNNNVMLNYQSDWNFVLAVCILDRGTPSTNGKNILRFIKEDLGFEVDPHTHEDIYNYADVAYLFQAAGVIPSRTVGGFLAFPPEQSTLERFWYPISGHIYPMYSWQAEILWGAATLGHINEESLWPSGIWKPKDKEHFLEHDENAPLPYVGNYGNTWTEYILWDSLNLLLQQQLAGKLIPGTIYTCTIFVSQDMVLKPGFIEEFQQQLHQHKTTGSIVWVGLKQVVDIWHNEYNSQPNIFPFVMPTGVEQKNWMLY